ICFVNDILSSRGRPTGLWLSPDVDAQERRQFVEGSRRRTRRPAPAIPAWLPPLTDHVEDSVLPVDGKVEPGDDAVAVEQRHHEVAPALGLWYVDLELEVEIPERQRSVPIADQIVEGRQQRRPWHKRSGLDLL